jgi:hypothetical protein
MESPSAARAAAAVRMPTGDRCRCSAAPPETLLTVRQLRRLLSGELDAGGNSFDEKFTREFEAGGRERAARRFFAHGTGGI